MSAPLTVAHVLAPAPYGGLERVVCGLASGHGARGHRIHVISVFEQDGAVHPLPLGAAVTQHVLRIPRRRYDRERAAVAALCRQVGAQVMHTHGYRPDVVDGPAARARGCRSVTTVHGFTGGGLKNRVFEWLQVRAYRRFDAVVAVSRLLESQLAARGVPRERLHAIPNARLEPEGAVLERAAARRALGVAADGPVIGWVGRLTPEKGPDVLLGALARIVDLDWTAAVVGSGPLAGTLRETAERLGLKDRVVWCGHVPDAARVYRAFDAFVLSSRTEGTPIALLEAMAGGAPLVLSRVGGVPDVVGENEAALVPPGDDAALAAALRAVLAAGPETAARVTAARRRLADAYAPEPWLDRYETLYRTLVTARGPRGDA